MDSLVKRFQQLNPHLVKEMTSSTHHYDDYRLNPYHLEGDVWAHTQMVCLMAKETNASILEQYACILHDVGKPLAREVDHESKKVKFYGHEGLSVFIALDFLIKEKVSDRDIQTISEIISMHTDLFKVIKRPDAKEKIVSKFIGNKKLLQSLINVAICDAHGRFYDPEQAAHFPREASYWDQYLKEIKEHKVPFKPKKATVLVGPPLSGKSTWIKENASEDDFILSRDQVILDLCPGLTYSEAYKKLDQDPKGPSMISQEFEKRKREAVKSGKNIIFDLTHMSAKSRRRSLSSLPKDYRKQALVFLTPYDVLISRNITREQEEGKSIPLRVLHDMMKSFTAPLYHEVEVIDYIIHKKNK